MKGYAAAQAAYDAQTPEEYIDPEECDHVWRYLGEADGDCFYKCRICGMEGEQ